MKFKYNMEQEKILEEMGLSQSEVKSYIASLEIGSATNGEIAKKANLNRSNCNEALKKLMNRGLISYVTKANKRYYKATNPKYILKLLKEKQEKVKEIIPKLEEKRKFHKKQQEANIYEGHKGIKTVFEDILDSLKSREEYLVFNAIDVPETFNIFIESWTKRRIDKKIKLKIIFHEESKEMIKKYKKQKLTEVRTLPKKYITPAVINVYGDKTAIILWTKEPLAFVVKNRDYSDSFRQYFRLLWKNAKKA